MGWITVRRYCLCGATLSARSTKGSAAEGVAAVFDLVHSDAGCGPATPAQAAAARRREEKSLLAAGGGGG